MELIPAIDLLGGRVVRLARGSYADVTAYDDDPVAVARRWEEAGASRLHLVDLDGAREGRPAQARLIASIVSAVGIACQVAGGLRTDKGAAAALGTGADRVVLGSALIDEPALARRLVDDHGAERIVAAIDVRDDAALGDGWVDGARRTDAIDHARVLLGHGIRRFAVTAVARDGMLDGPDVALLERVRVAAPGAAVIASGGVTRVEDVEELHRRGFEAAILGRALYEGRLELPQALAAIARA